MSGRLRHLVLGVLIVGTIVTAAADRPLAWGPDGHRIVARIALTQLTPDVRRQIEWILDGEDFVESANWADRVRPDRPETYNWHFVDVPYGIYEYDRARDCAPSDRGDCLLAALDRLRETLADRSARREDRAEALKFLIHFVGDMHQPLHSITNNDRGGNDVLVDLGGDPQPSNLHSVWDRAIVARRGLDWEAYARVLLAELDRRPQPPPVVVDPLAWALESHRLAEEHVYRYPGFTPGSPPATPVRLDAAYWEQAAPVVDRQLLIAGVRLAALLEATLSGGVR